MNDLESGLFLPIRFYYQQTEQDRFKPQSEGVALTELNYPYVDCVSLAPFQVTYVNNVLALGVHLNAFCADSGEMISLTYNSAHWQEFIDTDGVYHLSYMGTDDFTGELNNGLYYLGVVIQFSNGSPYFYSDLFMIKNCSDTPYDTEEFRVHSPKVGTLYRTIDGTDLRIVKT